MSDIFSMTPEFKELIEHNQILHKKLNQQREEIDRLKLEIEKRQEHIEELKKAIKELDNKTKKLEPLEPEESNQYGHPV